MCVRLYKSGGRLRFRNYLRVFKYVSYDLFVEIVRYILKTYSVVNDK